MPKFGIPYQAAIQQGFHLPLSTTIPSMLPLLLYMCTHFCFSFY